MSNKKPIRIPFREDENKKIIRYAKMEHLKRATFITVILLKSFFKFEKKNRHQVNLKFEFEVTEIPKPIYIQISVYSETYEKIKTISDITNISIPHICRYLIIPEIKEEE